jgi:hypothetical protein
MALKRLCPALLFHDVALVLSDVLQDSLLEDRRHVEVAEQEEPSPIALVHGGGQGLDTVLLQLFHLVLVRRSQELLHKRQCWGSGFRSASGSASGSLSFGPPGSASGSVSHRYGTGVAGHRSQVRIRHGSRLLIIL